VTGKNVQVAAIYFPSWHDEPRRVEQFGSGWSEWELIKAGRPRFEGHYQPIVPAWGYADETVPENMQRSCDAARTAGIDAFLWDWYWYDEQDFLNRPLDETFLNLEEPGIQFALMWANHDWRDVFPATNGVRGDLFGAGAVDARQFREMTDIIVERYFRRPHYWKPDGRNWFSIYELSTLVNGLGGFDQTREALADFRNRSIAAGTGDLHINVLSSFKHYEVADIVSLGIDSVGDYNWASLMPLDQGLQLDYVQWRKDAAAQWGALSDRYAPDLAYIPNLTMGWDSTTRVSQDEEITIGDWPYLPVITGNTPEEFAIAAREILEFVDEQNGPRIITINAWNEWTEGSYLEPDTRYGMGYLDALKSLLNPG
jgi:hypothetical protein